VPSYRASDWSGDRQGSHWEFRRAAVASAHARSRVAGAGGGSGNAALSGLKGKLKSLPMTIAHDVAQRAGPLLTGLSLDAFKKGVKVYGEPRPVGVNGDTLMLRRTGRTEQSLRFRVAGTIVKCVLGTPYAKYLVGKYGVLPNGALPAAWSRQLDRLLAETRVTL
jgi:hypothetical protein